MNLFIFDDIDMKMVNHTIRALISNSDPKIYVYINSDGGEIDCAYAIYEALQYSGKEVITHAVNRVYSSAVVIYLAGSKRFTTNFSNFMIHEVYHTAEGEGSNSILDYKKGLTELTVETNKYLSFISSRTKFTVQGLKKRISTVKGDYYFDTETAMKYQLAHEIGFPLGKVVDAPK